jgi:hypothetical protein
MESKVVWKFVPLYSVQHGRASTEKYDGTYRSSTIARHVVLNDSKVADATIA